MRRPRADARCSRFADNLRYASEQGGSLATNGSSGDATFDANAHCEHLHRSETARHSWGGRGVTDALTDQHSKGRCRSDPSDGHRISACPTACPKPRQSGANGVIRCHIGGSLRGCFGRFSSNEKPRKHRHFCLISGVCRESGRQDSNLRPLDPQSSTLANCATPRSFSLPAQILQLRTRGLEPPRGCPHQHLKLARLPISPRALVKAGGV